MNLGLKNVYFLAFVRKPKSNAKLKSDKPLFKNLHIVEQFDIFVSRYIHTYTVCTERERERERERWLAYPACLASSLDMREKISATTGLVFCRINPQNNQIEA